MNQNFSFGNNMLHALSFASPTAIHLLGANPHWNTDGTFRTVLRLFYQSYSTHTWDAYSMKPVVYATLPNKKDNTYDVVLNELIAYVQSNSVSLSPKSILIDFETAAYNAFSKNFAMATVESCQFQFGQNIWRQIKNKGLISFSKREEARCQIANILILPLLPPQEINTTLCDIVEDISNVHQSFLKLTDHILPTYIENALFSPSFWNLFDLIGIRPKTNNHVEGCHGQLNSHCQIHSNL